MGWALHYFPFYLMARQLFLHHYFPALWYSILLGCGVFDLVTSSLRPRVRLYIASGLLVVAIWSFSYFSPIAYGGPWTRSQCERARWLKTWDFSCNDFPLDYAAYSKVGTATPVSGTLTSVVSVVGGEGEGRAPVVVEGEAVGNAPVIQNEETTTGRGAVPEPGRDVFANVDAGMDLRSMSQVKGNEEKPVIEKEISTVLGEVLGETTTSEESKDTKEASIYGEDPVVEDKEIGTSEKVENGLKEPNGPLAHDEQEAEIARNDLFAEEG